MPNRPKLRNGSHDSKVLERDLNGGSKGLAFGNRESFLPARVRHARACAGGGLSFGGWDEPSRSLPGVESESGVEEKGDGAAMSVAA